MMADLETFGELADANRVCSGKTFDGQHGLVLLAGEAGSMGSVFAETEKFPQCVTELGQHFVMLFGDFLFPRGKEHMKLNNYNKHTISRIK